ncbi:hypothetical protein Tcan_01345, partial [Toxocara canis]
VEENAEDQRLCALSPTVSGLLLCGARHFTIHLKNNSFDGMNESFFNSVEVLRVAHMHRVDKCGYVFMWSITRDVLSTRLILTIQHTAQMRFRSFRSGKSLNFLRQSRLASRSCEYPRAMHLFLPIALFRKGLNVHLNVTK